MEGCFYLLQVSWEWKNKTDSCETVNKKRPQDEGEIRSVETSKTQDWKVKVEGVDYFGKVEMGMVCTCLVREYCQKYELGNIIFLIPIVEAAPEGRMEENHAELSEEMEHRMGTWMQKRVLPVASGNTLLCPARDLSL